MGRTMMNRPSGARPLRCIAALASSSSRSLSRLQCLRRMSPLPLQPDAAGLAFLCHRKALRPHSSLVLRHAARFPHHPQVHPRQRMPPEKPCAPYRQFARPFCSNIDCIMISLPFSSLISMLIRLCSDSLFNLADDVLNFSGILFSSAISFKVGVLRELAGLLPGLRL